MPLLGLIICQPGSATPSSHHKIFPRNIFPRVGLPRNLFLIGSLTTALRFSQGLGPKRPESCDGNRVYGSFLVNSVVPGTRGTSVFPSLAKGV